MYTGKVGKLVHFWDSLKPNDVPKKTLQDRLYGTGGLLLHDVDGKETLCYIAIHDSILVPGQGPIPVLQEGKESELFNLSVML